MLYNLSQFLIKSIVIILILLLSIEYNAVAQKSDFIRPKIIDKFKKYKQQIKSNSAQKMVELKTVIPDIIYDLRYASTNNFMNRFMYPKNTSVTFLRTAAASALLQVQKELNIKGLGLKIFDAYRPYSVTVKFWELVKDERYVANPAKGSGHNRGTTVDLTIIKLKSGDELDMGTGFDNFSDTAHHNFTNLKEELLQNRLLLKNIMTKHGFKPYEIEWWHYSFTDSIKYEILDIDFKKLKKIL